MSRVKYFYASLVSIILFLSDIYFKQIFFASSKEYFIFGDFIKLKFALNPGVAFGIDIFSYKFILVFYILALPVLLFVLMRRYKERDLIQYFALSLVFFGALSNLIDRLMVGGVIDYIDISHFSILNIADIMIVVGALIIAFISLTPKNDEENLSLDVQV